MHLAEPARTYCAQCACSLNEAWSAEHQTIAFVDMPLGLLSAASRAKLLPVAAKRKGNVNRLLNPHWASARDLGWKLWDRDGRLWELHNEKVGRDRVEALYSDPAVPVAIAQETRGLEWIEPEQRRSRWKVELERRTFDPTWTWESKRSLPFSVLEFKSDGDVLLLFYDSD